MSSFSSSAEDEYSDEQFENISDASSRNPQPSLAYSDDGVEVESLNSQAQVSPEKLEKSLGVSKEADDSLPTSILLKDNRNPLCPPDPRNCLHDEVPFTPSKHQHENISPELPKEELSIENSLSSTNNITREDVALRSELKIGSLLQPADPKAGNRENCRSLQINTETTGTSVCPDLSQLENVLVKPRKGYSVVEILKKSESRALVRGESAEGTFAWWTEHLSQNQSSPPPVGMLSSEGILLDTVLSLWMQSGVMSNQIQDPTRRTLLDHQSNCANIAKRTSATRKKDPELKEQDSKISIDENFFDHAAPAVDAKEIFDERYINLVAKISEAARRKSDQSTSCSSYSKELSTNIDLALSECIRDMFANPKVISSLRKQVLRKLKEATANDKIPSGNKAVL